MKNKKVEIKSVKDKPIKNIDIIDSIIANRGKERTLKFKKAYRKRKKIKPLTKKEYLKQKRDIKRVKKELVKYKSLLKKEKQETKKVKKEIRKISKSKTKLPNFNASKGKYICEKLLSGQKGHKKIFFLKYKNEKEREEQLNILKLNLINYYGFRGDKKINANFISLKRKKYHKRAFIAPEFEDIVLTFTTPVRKKRSKK